MQFSAAEILAFPPKDDPFDYFLGKPAFPCLKKQKEI